ncbi:radical SAM protein [bacterium]|nr:radical SAM protein [bacterium]
MEIKYSISYYLRNIKQNAFLSLSPLPKTPSVLTKFLYNLKILFFTLKFLIRHKQGKLDIPKIEFMLTNVCNLKCKYCSNYTSAFKENLNYEYEDFKSDLDTLLKETDSISELVLTGGEPFLVYDLDKFIEFAASQQKIKKIKIETNGTIIPNSKIIDILKQFRKKIVLDISDYSQSPNLDASILKIEQIKSLCDENKINYIHKKDEKWFITQNYKKNYRSENDLKNIYSLCLPTNISCFDGKISQCPKATSFNLLGLCSFSQEQGIDLRSENLSKQKIIDWYTNIIKFDTCDFCNHVDYEQRRKRINAGEQIEESLYW